MAAVAGLVPWALSGSRMTRRLAPLARRDRRISMTPVSSPAAPALGWRVTLGSPVISLSHSWRLYSRARLPCTYATWAMGWVSVNPGRAATLSLSLGLCFMVQEPRG